jgi:hypothetical protein
MQGVLGTLIESEIRSAITAFDNATVETKEVKEE